jgi:hypothetical protein
VKTHLADVWNVIDASLTRQRVHAAFKALTLFFSRRQYTAPTAWQVGAFFVRTKNGIFGRLLLKKAP